MTIAFLLSAGNVYFLAPKKTILLKNVQEALNNQVNWKLLHHRFYLAMASWCEIQTALDGVSEFFSSKAMKKEYTC